MKPTDLSRLIAEQARLTAELQRVRELIKKETQRKGDEKLSRALIQRERQRQATLTAARAQTLFRKSA